MSQRVRQRPARKPVVAPVTLHQFEALDHTHAEVVQALKRLEGLVDRLDAQGVDDVVHDGAKELCSFFDSTARAHHEEEERVVFPPLLASGDAELIQHVQRLQQDHGWLEEDWRELRTQLMMIADGQTGHDSALVREMSEVFGALYMEHIALEESLIYPASRERLSTAESAAHTRSESSS
jgi:hemerythrin-like domain-containing protein